MISVFSIRADITLTSTNRQQAIRGNTYRPLLLFSTITRSGLIVLGPNECLEMDQSYTNRLIQIYFYQDLDLEKEFFTGRSFLLSEGGPDTGLIGKGVITVVVGVENMK